MSQSQAPALPAPSPAERLVRTIDGLCAVIAARGVGGMLTAPLLFLLWSRLRRLATLATQIAGRIAAGTPPAAARHRAAKPRPPRPPTLRLPRGYAWLVKLVPGAAAYGSQLQYLLADPLMAPLAAEPKLRRMLNPLCQMLGVAKPPPPSSLRPAAAPPRPPRPERDSNANPAGCDPPPQAAPVAA